LWIKFAFLRECAYRKAIPVMDKVKVCAALATPARERA